eukprot:TRINITY_DN10690_c0_g1_i1.p1 TRINITY_DN10690_c0_g1~~TRINITY_DN10690_c0_g1_i1.p1  ORF type:complete len:152 (+),score=38.33 TRINITY_DN10690_c0_g1_i1:163-618(+)
MCIRDRYQRRVRGTVFDPTMAIKMMITIACLLMTVVAAGISCPSMDSHGARGQRLMGGFTDSKPADQAVKELLAKTEGWQDKALSAVQASGENRASLGEYEICSYKTQVVAGTNYEVRIALDGGKTMEVLVFQPLPYLHQPPELTAARIAP